MSFWINHLYFKTYYGIFVINYVKLTKIMNILVKLKDILNNLC